MENFKSADGVEASIYLATDEDQQKHPGAERDHVPGDGSGRTNSDNPYKSTLHGSRSE